MSPAAARALAHEIFAFIASDPDRIEAFFASSGADPSRIREMVNRPEFAEFIFDFILQSDQGLLAFCQESGGKPQHVQTAREVLFGPKEYF